MKDIIVTVGLILLGVVIFTLIMTGDNSLLAQTKDFFGDMSTRFGGLDTAAGAIVARIG
jgi:hypothetical protein